MRTRVLALAALFAVSADLSAQRLPLPRIGRGTPTPPTENPEPAAGPVARQLAITRSHWSLEGYTMVSSMHVPTESGMMTTFTMLGTGTHGDYRLTDNWSSTMDVTVSGVGYGALWESFEPGARYNFMPHDAELRPYLDVRGDFTHMYDTYTMPYGAIGGPNINGQNGNFYQQSRYSRGFGGVFGGGIEYTLTNTLALNTGFNAMRNHMRIYNLAQPGTVPVGSNFWMTSYRYTLGIRYNWLRTNHLSQNPLK
jgi:hypothetical protein